MPCQFTIDHVNSDPTNPIAASLMTDAEKCTGNVETCPDAECIACGLRECPNGEPMHFHHDGCPACPQ